MTIQELNNLSDEQLKEELFKCCGSSLWGEKMMAAKPFSDMNDLLAKADRAWNSTNEKDWMEAFSHHPKIGDLKSLEKKFASTKALAGSEQASVHSASQKTLEQLAEGNTLYENKFGFIFIVCATGKSAEKMLAMLNDRITNDRTNELKMAAGEQQKIIKLRLQKILS